MNIFDISSYPNLIYIMKKQQKLTRLNSIFLLGVIFFFLVTGLSCDNKTFDIRIMTYNIRYAAQNNNIHDWTERRDGVVTILSSADIAGLQEVLPEQKDYLLEQLTGYGMVFRTRESDPFTGEGVPILYNKEVFAVIDSGTFWLSDTPEKPGSNTWGAACNRVTTWALFAHDKSTKKFYVFNTHLDHVSQEAREKSIDLIIHRIDDSTDNLPVILLGDFNVEEHNLVYQKIIEHGELKDAFTEDHSISAERDMTFHGWDPAQKARRIDYVFVSEHFNVKETKVIQSMFGGQYPSDHLPVSILLALD